MCTRKSPHNIDIKDKTQGKLVSFYQAGMKNNQKVALRHRKLVPFCQEGTKVTRSVGALGSQNPSSTPRQGFKMSSGPPVATAL